VNWPVRKEIYFGWILLIAAAVVFLRLWEPGINFDSAVYAVVARNFAQSLDFWNLHFSPYLFPQFYVHPPLAIWLQGMLFGLFGATDTVARLLNGFCGLGLVCVCVWVGARLVQPAFGVVVGVGLLTCYQFLYASASFLLDVSCAFFGSLCLPILILGLERQRWSWIQMLGVSGALAASLMCKGVFGFVLPASLWVYVCLIDLPAREKLKWSLATMGGFLLPLGYFGFQAELGMYPYLYHYFYEMFFTDSQRNDSGGFQWGLLRTWFVNYVPWSLVFVGSWFGFRKTFKTHRFYLFLWIFSVANFVFFAFSRKSMGHYLIQMVPVMALGAASGLWSIPWLKRSDRTRLLLGSLTAWALLLNVASWIYPGPIRLSDGVYRGFEEIRRIYLAQGVSVIHVLSHGIDENRVRARGQWYWELPIVFVKPDALKPDRPHPGANPPLLLAPREVWERTSLHALSTYHPVAENQVWVLLQGAGYSSN
jgi:4-amino-4-deoxy-L-arabinose transferase-like glycosyltransferase